MKKNVKIILIGGFLGAGKTTLISSLAKIISKKLKIGLISNDQAENLVDTHIFEQTAPTCEVSGSCFCCNFNGFLGAIESLVTKGAEVIIAEPVGSCTDLVSTIIKPLKKFHKEFSVSKLCVLLDPRRFNEAFLKATLDVNASYIVSKQIEEADTLVISKSDLWDKKDISNLKKMILAEAPEKDIIEVSAKTGKNVKKFADIILKDTANPKTKMRLDYDKYAVGEASLGWLNLAGSLCKKEAQKQNLSVFVRNILLAIKKELKLQKVQIGHIKAYAEFENKSILSNIVSTDSAISLSTHKGEFGNKFILNARVEIGAAKLKKIILEILSQEHKGGFEIKKIKCKSLTPGRPNTTYRL